MKTIALVIVDRNGFVSCRAEDGTTVMRGMYSSSLSIKIAQNSNGDTKWNVSDEYLKIIETYKHEKNNSINR